MRKNIYAFSTLLLCASLSLRAQQMDGQQPPPPPPDMPQQEAQLQPGTMPQQQGGMSQQPPRGPQGMHPRPHGGDPMGENFFPPELLMHHQQALGLSEEQKKFFKSEVQKMQAQATDLQWQLPSEMEKMEALLKSERVDEQQVLAQVDKIMNLERDMKRLHLTLLIRIKNKLTPEQQTKLREMKNQMRGEGPPRPGAASGKSPDSGKGRSESSRDKKKTDSDN